MVRRLTDFQIVEILQTESAEMYITRYQHEEAIIKYLHEFLCANGALKFPGRPRPS